MNLRVHRLAVAEIDHEVDYYEARQPGLGAELEDEIDAAFAMIRRFPEAAPRWSNRSTGGRARSLSVHVAISDRRSRDRGPRSCAYEPSTGLLVAPSVGRFELRRRDVWQWSRFFARQDRGFSPSSATGCLGSGRRVRAEHPWRGLVHHTEWKLGAVSPPPSRRSHRARSGDARSAPVPMRGSHRDRGSGERRVCPRVKRTTPAFDGSTSGSRSAIHRTATGPSRSRTS